MLGRLATLLGVLLLVAGCSPTPPSGFVNGTSLHHIKVGGHDRSYRLYEPAGIPASAALVVVLHGYSGSARQVERDYQWDGLADSDKFVVAYPDGLGRAWNVDGETCCGRPGREGVDDVAFIGAAVADIAKNVGTNPAKVYVTGMSNGGIMSYTLACTTDIFAAIGPVAGTQLELVPDPASDVGHPHSWHRRSARPLWRRAGFQRHRRSPGAGRESFLARRRSVRHPDRHNRWPGDHVDRPVRR